MSLDNTERHTACVLPQAPPSGSQLHLLSCPQVEELGEWPVPHCFTIFAAQKTIVVAARWGPPPCLHPLGPGSPPSCVLLSPRHTPPCARLQGCVTQSSLCGEVVTNPTSIREDVGSIPGVTRWVKDLAPP